MTKKREKMKKKKKKNKKKDKKREKTRWKKRKRGPKGVFSTRDGHKKKIFHIRTVKRNRNEIEARKKSDFEHPTKTKKMKSNEIK